MISMMSLVSMCWRVLKGTKCMHNKNDSMKEKNCYKKMINSNFAVRFPSHYSAIRYVKGHDQSSVITGGTLPYYLSTLIPLRPPPPPKKKN